MSPAPFRTVNSIRSFSVQSLPPDLVACTVNAPVSPACIAICVPSLFTLNIVFLTGEQYFVKRHSGVLLVYEGMTDPDADCTLKCAKLQLMGMMMGRQDVFENVETEGDATVPVRLVKYMTPFTFNFNIIEP